MRVVMNVCERFKVVDFGEAIAKARPPKLTEPRVIKAILEKKNRIMLEVSDLHVKYGTIEALHGISFRVRRGGNRGAARGQRRRQVHDAHDIMPASAGRAAGNRGAPSPVTGRLPHRRAHTWLQSTGSAWFPEGRHIFGNLTVFENLKLATFARNDKQQIERDYEGYSRSSPPCRPQNAEGGSLSGGEEADACLGARSCAACASSCSTSPRWNCLLLMLELFRSSRASTGRDTILVVEQNARIALKYPHRAYVLEAERLFGGKAEDLATNPEIQKAYLG